MPHVHFVDDICRYFYNIYGIEDLDIEVSDCVVREETEMLMLDKVFEKYILKYLEEK